VTNSELAEEVYPIAATMSASEQREEAAGLEADKKTVELEPVSALADAVVDVQGDVLGSQAVRAFHLQLDSEGLVPEVDDKVVEPTTAEVDEGAAPTEVEEKRVVADLRPEKPAFTDLALREVGAVDAVALKATGATTEEATTDAIPAEMLE
jgi:hypothetical protein